MSRVFAYHRGTHSVSDWNGHEDYPSVWVMIIDDDAGETLAEFRISYDRDATGLVLEAFDDAWPIFAEYPELGPALGKLGSDPTLDQFVALLERLGAVSAAVTPSD